MRMSLLQINAASAIVAEEMMYLEREDDTSHVEEVN